MRIREIDYNLEYIFGVFGFISLLMRFSSGNLVSGTIVKFIWVPNMYLDQIESCSCSS